MRLLKDLDASTIVGDGSILDTIDYKNMEIYRIISFIENEWNSDFSDLIANTNKDRLGNKIASL